MAADDFNSPLAELLAELSTEALYFENCYLTETGRVFLSADDPVENSVPTNSREFRLAVNDVHTAPHSEIRCVSWAENGIPEDVVECIQTADFARIHVAESVNDNTLQIFHTVLLLCEALADQSTLIVISATQGMPPGSVSMESLMWESEIRVPLWIRVPGQESARLQQLVSTQDIISCVHEWLAGAGHGSLKILQPAESPMITIRTTTAVGVRTPEFLFVRQPETEEQHEQTALYAKPEDGWNVNDVSAEYQQATETLAELCPQNLINPANKK